MEHNYIYLKGMKTQALILPIIFLFLYGCGKNQKVISPGTPNILLIMTDDQGYGDLGLHGNPFIRTPVLDSLASLSTRIDPFYVCPVCAPTRSSLMTGRYHLRTGVYDTYNGGAMMSTDEVTIAEVLRENGYQTAMIGKWHLGDAYPMRPMDQGFQYYLAHKGGGIGQPGDDFGNFTRPDSSYFNPFLWENGKRVRKEGYCSDIFTDQAMEFIHRHHRESDDPFFLYLAYNAPHTPLQLPAAYEEEYRDLVYDPEDFTTSGINLRQMRDRDMEDARKVYGMVSNIDDNLGRLWNTLRELNIEENTLVVFLTDNGPQQQRYTAGLNGKKGSVLEGGIRVPCFFYWKGSLEKNRIIRYPSAHIDMMPTLLDIAGIQYAGNMDGTSLLPLLRGEKEELEERSLYFGWARGYPQRYTNMAVHRGPYKLVGLTEHGEPDDHLRLFNLEDDPYELNNLSGDQPEIRDALKQEIDSWYEDIIQSPNLLDPPRMILGSVEENPVILGRNDWKGPKATHWSSSDAFGYWDVDVKDSGPYDVRLVYRDPFPHEGKAFIRVGVRQYWITNQDTSISEITIPAVHFDPGEQILEGWYNSRGEIFTPIYIEVFKKDL